MDTLAKVSKFCCGFFVCVCVRVFLSRGCSQGLEGNFSSPHCSQSCLYAPGTAVDKLERCAMFGKAVAGLSFSFSFSCVTKEEEEVYHRRSLLQVCRLS